MALQTRDFSVTGKSSGGGITYTFILRVTENSVNTAANTSNLTVKAILKQSYSGTAFYSWGTGVQCSLNGTQIFSDYQKRRLDGTAEAVYYTWTGDIAHDGNGKLTLNVSGKLWQNSATTYTPPTMTVSGTMPLTAIARESTVGAAAANIGESTTVSVNRKNSAYTHSIAYSFGALSGYIGADWAHSDTEVKLTDTSIAFAIPESFYAQIPNSPTGVCTLTVKTYSGNTRIGGDKTCTFTVTAANCEPDVTGTVVDINEKTLALTGNEKVLVKFFSTAQCTIQAEVKHHATVSKRYIGGVEVTDSVHTIENVETADILFRAEDSRGYPGTDTDETVTLLEYIRLTNNASVTRDDPTSGNATVKLSGGYYDGAFREGIHNALTVQYRVGGGEWVTAQRELSFADGRYSGILAISGLDYTASHTVEIAVSDLLDTAVKTLTVNKGIPVFDWGESDFQFHVPVSAPGFLGRFGGLYIRSFYIASTPSFTIRTKYSDFTGDGGNRQSIFLFGYANAEQICGVLGVRNSGRIEWSGHGAVTGNANADGTVTVSFAQNVYDHFGAISPENFEIIN